MSCNRNDTCPWRPSITSSSISPKFMQKRFYNSENIPFINISTLAESPSTLSWLAWILESRNELIFWLGKGLWKIFALFHNSTQQLFLYLKSLFFMTFILFIENTLLKLIEGIKKFFEECDSCCNTVRNNISFYSWIS